MMAFCICFLAAPGLSGGLWDQFPWTEIEPRPPALGAQSLNHWTTREVLVASALEPLIDSHLKTEKTGLRVEVSCQKSHPTSKWQNPDQAHISHAVVQGSLTSLDFWHERGAFILFTSISNLLLDAVLQYFLVHSHSHQVFWTPVVP